MNTTSYYMRVTALNPVSHIGKTASTGALFNTEKVNGKEVPFITGASGKGILRRIGMEVMLSMLGLDPEQYQAEVITDQPNPLTQHRIEVLFNGSILNSKGRRINIDEGALLSELIPWFAVVGGCLGNTMMQGRIAVHPMTLICQENEERLRLMEQDINRRIGAEQIEIFEAEAPLKPARHWLQRQEYTHNDDFNRLGSSASRFLPAPAAEQLLADKQAAFVDRQDPVWQDKESGSHVQMRFSLQTLTAMSQFYWQIDTFDLTLLMEAAFQTTMGHFLGRAYIGGQRRQGLGLVNIESLGRAKIEPVKAEYSSAVGFTQAERAGQQDLYRQHLETRRAEIIQALETIAAK